MLCNHPFIFLFSDLEVRISIILHMTVTKCHMSQSHNHMSQENIEGSRIMMLYYISIAYSIHVF